MTSKPKVINHTLVLDSDKDDDFKYDFSGLKELAEERGDVYDESWTSKTCSNCKNTFDLKITRISGWNDREEYSCPYCGKEYYHHCFDVQVRKIKNKMALKDNPSLNR